jgi:hypothetical protein
MAKPRVNLAGLLDVGRQVSHCGEERVDDDEPQILVADELAKVANRSPAADVREPPVFEQQINLFQFLVSSSAPLSTLQMPSRIGVATGKRSHCRKGVPVLQANAIAPANVLLPRPVGAANKVGASSVIAPPTRSWRSISPTANCCWSLAAASFARRLGSLAGWQFDNQDPPGHFPNEAGCQECQPARFLVEAIDS